MRCRAHVQRCFTVVGHTVSTVDEPQVLEASSCSARAPVASAPGSVRQAKKLQVEASAPEREESLKLTDADRQYMKDLTLMGYLQAAQKVKKPVCTEGDRRDMRDVMDGICRVGERLSRRAAGLTPAIIAALTAAGLAPAKIAVLTDRVKQARERQQQRQEQVVRAEVVISEPEVCDVFEISEMGS